MPEFIIENKAELENTETAFVSGFIQCMFFQEQSCFPASRWEEPEVQEAILEGQADGCLPSDVGYTDIHPDTLLEIRKFCEAFQERAKVELALAYERGYSEEQAGMDFCFTYAGAGVGFTDRDELTRSSDQHESDRLKAIMRADGTTPDEWSALLKQVQALESDLGGRLSELAGRGEINPWFADHVDHGNAPFVYVHLS